jgi:hypothetical protein
VCCHLLEFVLIVLDRKYVHGHLCFLTGSGFDTDSMERADPGLGKAKLPP